MQERHKITAPGLVAEIVPTDGEHIYFDANQHSGMDKDFPSAHWMEIRGIVYGLSAHLHKWKDGTWNIGKDDNTGEGTRLFHHLWMSRASGHKHNDATDAARRKAAETITALVRQWITDNPKAMAQAERKALEEALTKVRAKIAELQASIDTATAEAEALEARLHDNPFDTAEEV
jgi:hypothetical protein